MLTPEIELSRATITAFGRLELECCERKILLGWLELELELVAGVVREEITVALEESRPAEHSEYMNLGVHRIQDSSTRCGDSGII